MRDMHFPNVYFVGHFKGRGFMKFWRLIKISLTSLKKKYNSIYVFLEIFLGYGFCLSWLKIDYLFELLSFFVLYIYSLVVKYCQEYDFDCTKKMVEKSLINSVLIYPICRLLSNWKPTPEISPFQMMIMIAIYSTHKNKDKIEYRVCTACCRMFLAKTMQQTDTKVWTVKESTYCINTFASTHI